MIYLSNGRTLEYVVASGALGFDGKGWWWERPLVWLGLMRPEWFTVFIRTLTKEPRFYPKSNLSWIRPWTWLPFSPWSCVRTIAGGSVNKVGLWNPGFDWWCQNVGPRIDFQKYAVGGSIYGNGDELVYMAERLNQFNLAALEVNDSCPNTGHALSNVKVIVQNMMRVKKVCRHPLGAKLSVAQHILGIAKELVGIAEFISLNSVPWEVAFPGQQSPLRKLEERVGGGGGGVSGKPAQKENWSAISELADQGLIPVIAPSIMEFDDIARVRNLGASAYSFGAIHLPSHPLWLAPWTLFSNPCKPTRFIKKERSLRERIHFVK